MLTQKPKSLLFSLTAITLSLIIALLSLEGICIFLLNHPKIADLHPVLFAYTRYIYEGYDKEHIQISDRCAQYHPELFYTLKPGECVFNEREFKSRYYVNSMGLRDDEASLKAPEVIVLGDSFAMGWGVDQNETFASIIEQKTGLKTLNAGIASYGTIREMLLLSKLNLSNLKYLILQYCPNDCSENLEWRENGKLEISSREDYESERDFHRKMHRYYPGRYAIEAIKVWIEMNPLAWLDQKTHSLQDGSMNETVSSPQSQDGGPDDCARLLIQTLLHFTKKLPALKKTNVIFVNLKLDHEITPGFTDKVLSAAKDLAYPYKDQHLQVVRSSEFLRKRLHYYILDDHMNSAGHKAVADEIIKSMREN